jgi:hypothetical protein
MSFSCRNCTLEAATMLSCVCSSTFGRSTGSTLDLSESSCPRVSHPAWIFLTWLQTRLS